MEAPRLASRCDVGYSKKILGVQYAVPDYVHVSPECRDLISRIFVANPEDRITMPEIKSHPWFVRNLPADLVGDGTVSYEEPDQPMQNMNDIMQILAEATVPADGARGTTQLLCDDLDDFDDDMDLDLDIESVCHVIMPMIAGRPHCKSVCRELLMLWLELGRAPA